MPARELVPAAAHAGRGSAAGPAHRLALGTSDLDRAADERDRISDGHDRAAEARDARSDARDAEAEARADGLFVDTGSAYDRAEARHDRDESARNRQHAEDDREAASALRAHAARERAELLLDGLTGAHRRGAGMLELEREVMKAHRTRAPLVLAFVDVDGLKARNDEHGHAAGDELLRHVVDTVRAVVREYDLIVRYGGDEFVCALLGVDLAEAEQRFAGANARLAAACDAQVSVGLAQLAPQESLAELVGRADMTMYARRRGRRTRG